MPLVIILNLIDLHHIRAWPDSLQIVYRYRYRRPNWNLLVQTQLYYISYSSALIHSVLRLLLAEICKPVEFDPSQNKLRCTVLAVLSSRAIQQLGEAMLCWLDLSVHLASHTYTKDPYSHVPNRKPNIVFCSKFCRRKESRAVIFFFFEMVRDRLLKYINTFEIHPEVPQFIGLMLYEPMCWHRVGFQPPFMLFSHSLSWPLRSPFSPD